MSRHIIVSVQHNMNTSESSERLVGLTFTLIKQGIEASVFFTRKVSFIPFLKPIVRLSYVTIPMLRFHVDIMMLYISQLGINLWI